MKILKFEMMKKVGLRWVYLKDLFFLIVRNVKF